MDTTIRDRGGAAMARNDLLRLSGLLKTAQGKKDKEVLVVNVDDVEPKDQVRKRFRGIDELAVTLLTEGQQSPIIVFPKNADGKYVIQKGERRWRACKHAGIATIDAIVNDKVQSMLDETAGELIENIQRDDLTPVEIAEALDKFVQAGWKQKDIAQRIGKNPAYVSTHLSLLRMPDSVRELYDNEVCSDTETLNNLRLLFDLNEKRCHAVCAGAMSDGITRKQSRELLNDARRIQEEMEQGSNEDDPGQINAEPTNLKPKEISPASSDGALPPLKEGKEWKSVHPGSLIFGVRVTSDGEEKRGIIMTDRVAINPETVWVKTLDIRGKEKPVHVLISDIELVSIENKVGEALLC